MFDCFLKRKVICLNLIIEKKQNNSLNLNFRHRVLIVEVTLWLCFCSLFNYNFYSNILKMYFRLLLFYLSWKWSLWIVVILSSCYIIKSFKKCFHLMWEQTIIFWNDISVLLRFLLNIFCTLFNHFAQKNVFGEVLFESECTYNMCLSVCSVCLCVCGSVI